MYTSFNINFIHVAYILVIWERGNTVILFDWYLLPCIVVDEHEYVETK